MNPLLHPLPDHLAERCRVLGGAAPHSGAFVLYWLRQAQRGHENPALDVALHLAERLDRPLYVHQSLSPAYPYASDRLVRFVLEGAVDLHRELQAQGIAAAFHFEPKDAERELEVVRDLAARAAVVVTEDVPVNPWRQDARSLGRAPVVLVDAACILPMRLVAKRPERAFRFRKDTERARAERLTFPWPAFAGRMASALPAALPFTPLNLETADLSALVASALIDHGIGPVADTKGGSVAGYARWTTFRDQHLGTYARRRNDAADRSGVSRMSAYLHHGQVSPFTVAREAMAHGGPGADKWLDEFLVWRELAHAWCHHSQDPESLEALPDWARTTLEAHNKDPRPALFDTETLARGRTGDALWDAAQASLRVHGELHNNLRMTWGKALVGWSPTPAAALCRLIELNHRYALDGRDANSYGGLLWCLGLFDRPFEPPSPILGTVRPRPTEGHARRLDLAMYEDAVNRPTAEPAPKVAVIGAGLAGLACARTLADHQIEVTVFDKSRGLGGRMATRRVDGLAFDHGAQFFTARDTTFRRHVEAWAEQGLVARWQPQGRGDEAEPWWVATPRMTALARHLGAELDVKTELTATAVTRTDAGWQITAGDATFGPYDAVVVATPAPQAVPLLEAAPTLAAAAKGAVMHPCWAALVAFPQRFDAPDTLRPVGSPLAWAARDASKPGRLKAETWVLHASPDWSRTHLERTAADVLPDLLNAFEGALGQSLPTPTYATAHRWRYALAAQPVGQACLYDPSGLLACGDWCLGGRIEAAFLSGTAAAGRILNAAVERARSVD
ncbi:MAG: FAD-binding protein [Geminicoccaceae bacterium]|nr:MAG: FAD-binding protein [Geminicoccaceae bacterium]